MAQLVSQQLVAPQRRVYLMLMDCFGTSQTVSVSLIEGPTVADKTASVLAMMESAETAVKTYAAANNQDLTSQLEAGTQAIAAAIAQAVIDGTTPPSA